MQRNLDTRPRVRRSSDAGRSQGVEQKGKSRGERRKRRRHTRVAPQGDISLHLVQHGKRTTEDKIKKKDTPGCHCQDDAQPEQSGEHLVERCRLLAEKRKLVEKGEMREWRTRHSRNQLPNKKEKGPVEPEKEEEEDKLESFFCHLYEFHNPVSVVPAFVPAELPFTPAVPSVSVSVTGSPANLIHDAENVISTPSVFNTAHVISTPNFPVVSFANSIPASVFTSSSCIDTTQ